MDRRKAHRSRDSSIRAPLKLRVSMEIGALSGDSPTGALNGEIALTGLMDYPNFQVPTVCIYRITCPMQVIPKFGSLKI